MKTLTEIFSEVKEHLLTQMQKSHQEDSSHYCMYRNPDGLKCAVGCLIADACYTPDIEGNNVGNVIYAHDSEEEQEDFGKLRIALENSGITCDKETISMLTSLQHLHDNYEPWLWESKLDELEDNLMLEAA